jgi:hypothetical protein
MPIKTIPLSHLETNLMRTLTECSESGETLVVELPEGKLLAIHSLDPQEDDDLIDELLATHPQFKALLQKSKASPRESFPVDAYG